MLPFSVEFRTGSPVPQQVVDAVHRAVVSGQLRAGDAFPAVRSLSQELRIHPREARQAIDALLAAGFLQRAPGSGTSLTVAPHPPPTPDERLALLATDVRRLATEARRLGIAPDALVDALRNACTPFPEKPDASSH